MTVTLFKNTFSINEPYYTSISSALDRIKGGKSKELIEKIRAESDSAIRSSLKKKLPAVIYTGRFDERTDLGLQEHSGFISLDFDHIKNIADKFTELYSNKYIYSSWLSPSGDGIKCLVKTTAKTAKDHLELWLGLEQEFKGIDSACKNVSRIVYESYDENIYVNEDSDVWSKRIVSKVESTPLLSNDSSYNKPKYTNLKKIDIALNMIRNSTDGNKHDVLLSASRLMGGYISTGNVDEEVAIRLMEQEISRKPNINSTKDAMKTIIDGIADGKTKPIEDLENEVEKLPKVFEKMDSTLFELDSVIMERYSNGVSKGYTTGYKDFDSHYSVKLGCTTYLYGAPYHGKTQFWFQILVNLSKRHGLNHMIYSPESGDEADVYIELLTIVAKKDFHKDFSNQMSIEELDIAKKFVDKHFLIFDPKDKSIGLDNFLDYVTQRERELNVKIHMVTADPFNEFAQTVDSFKRQDLEIERLLTYARKNASGFNRHIAILTHIKDQQFSYDDNKNRFYPPATYREVAGGQAWSRKGQAMLSVWRPNKGLVLNGQTFGENETVVVVQKAKPKGIGKTGEVKFIYNPEEHTYKDYNGYTPSWDANEQVETTKYSQVENVTNYYEKERNLIPLAEAEAIGEPIEGKAPF